MIVEQFIKLEGNINQLRDALSTLHRINFFGVLLDVAANRSIPQPSSHPMETAALQNAWHNGYVEALHDLFYFQERYLASPGKEAQIDFGALDTLLRAGNITTEEYNELRTSKS